MFFPFCLPQNTHTHTHTHTHTQNYMRLESLVSLLRSVTPVLRLVTEVEYLMQVY